LYYAGFEPLVTGCLAWMLPLYTVKHGGFKQVLSIDVQTQH
jgi:hypothetical protein